MTDAAPECPQDSRLDTLARRLAVLFMSVAIALLVTAGLTRHASAMSCSGAPLTVASLPPLLTTA
jgi:hypothetical protein